MTSKVNGKGFDNDSSLEPQSSLSPLVFYISSTSCRGREESVKIGTRSTINASIFPDG